MRKNARTWAGVLGVTLLCVSVAACEGPGKGEEKTESKAFTFSGDKLTVSATNSDVRLRTGGTGGEVRVQRTVEGDAGKDDNSQWELSGSTLNLRTECHGISISCAARYTVTLPENLAVSLTSSNGSVDSVGLTQSQEIESSNAAVKVEKASGDVSLKVRDGNTEAIGISAGLLTAETRNGRLKVVFTEPPRKVTASTDNGNVNVTLPPGEDRYQIRVDAENGRSDSSVKNSPGAERSIEVRSTNGSARIDQAD
ncbi:MULTISPECIES: DUF4097 family beta strand repeat-containing protein [Streptomyces]|uniref:DUF4097 domain-containing protein n=1 Tax=Streptomyces odorifer TaxID=53450 RepID=A0A7Y6CBW7_9ACTN|nr:MULTISPECIES: DUF4097 family beta strand repeat-containing protein [Streptomyces]NUV34856.1 DUF4097 domain-containing protein [Streptomyces sp. KAI-27]NUV47786.1 DUF4097 domain-containing protein [Streptomyces sp. CAI-78]MBL0776457.1 DUF4097 family beta strand repeat protein [Streptomyces albidoflavus]MBL0803942.1 DUF4097 family beta strand repeat protein [Streptomyces albidoflavus]MBV1953762.1 DUF4097 domain-containing protein [Streptomyces sp. BV333]